MYWVFGAENLCDFAIPFVISFPYFFKFIFGLKGIGLHM
jgi:hypothetical protein